MCEVPKEKVIVKCLQTFNVFGYQEAFKLWAHKHRWGQNKISSVHKQCYALLYINQGCGVGGKTPDSNSDLFKISDSDTDSGLSKIFDSDSLT